MKRFLCALFTIIAINFSAKAELAFEITNTAPPKTKILFFGFNSKDLETKMDAAEILIRIQKNLKSTNLFEIIQDNSSPKIIQDNDYDFIADFNDKSLVGAQIDATRNKIPEKTEQYSMPNGQKIELKPSKTPLVSVEMLPDFTKYKKTDVGAIVVAEFNYDLKGDLEIRLRLWDVLDQRQLFGKFYSASRQNYKTLANLISDEIFKSLTGEQKGHFNTKIAYISESGNPRNRKKRLATVDFDGENRKFITNGRNIVLTPAFAKNPDEIYYVSYQSKKYPQIYSLNTRNNTSKSVGNFHTMTYAPSPHPTNPNTILLSAIYNGNSDIYKLNIAQNKALRLTSSKSIDTTASFSPDGQKIAFSSDRKAGQKIYLMNSDGTNIKKISKGRGHYAKPVFSPDGNHIAFTVQRKGRFYIGVMNKDGRNEQILTTGYMAEGAKFSPSGRYLLYSKTLGPYGQKSIPHLYTIDIVTGFEYKIPLPKNEGATDPDWVEIAV